MNTSERCLAFEKYSASINDKQTVKLFANFMISCKQSYVGCATAVFGKVSLQNTSEIGIELADGCMSFISLK